MIQHPENSSATVEVVARAIVEQFSGDFDLLSNDGKEVARGEARAAIKALRDHLTDEMRFAVWFDQYRFLGASEVESAIVATKRFVDEEQKAQDIRAFQAMMNAALGEMPEGMRAAFAGATR